MSKHITPKVSGTAERWKAYTGMAAAFVAVGADADAQIIYTDVNPDEVLVNNTFNIDFDGDGNNDLLIMHSSTSTSGIQANGAGISGEVIGAVNSSFLYPTMLGAGAAIAPSDPNWQASYAFGTLALLYSYGGSTFAYGAWAGQTGYLGVRFTSGAGEVHYAWVQLSVGATVQNVVVLGYAYQSTPNMAINAGDDGTIGMSDAVAAALDASIFPNPATRTATLQLDAVKAGEYQISIINGMGQVMSSQQVNTGTGIHRFDLDLSALSAGTYFVEVRHADGVIFRKVTKEG